MLFREESTPAIFVITRMLKGGLIQGVAFLSLYSWGERLRSPELQSKIRGPIYFMWGTDHEDQVTLFDY